jgi:murein DD-endopeptidase MepM/ murein hydrolase activator NlpD
LKDFPANGLLRLLCGIQVRVMSSLEKFAFLGAVALASVLIAQELDKTVATLDRPSEAVDLEEAQPPTSPADSQPTLLSFAPGPTGFLDTLTACKGMAPSFSPNVDKDLLVTDYKRFVLVEGSVRLATAPIGGGCLSSVFGPRNGSLHKGLDYYSPNAVPVFAAADGILRRKRYRNDYGNMIVLDHGRGVFTRYAHLESFADPDEGERVIAGQYLGMMGNTAGYLIPRHLHYEVLTGKWGAQAGSFALTPVDVMSLPEASN